MGEILGLDAGIMKFLSKVSDICIISILWLICCLPIVTIGASTTAAYYTMVKVVKREIGTLHKEFFRSFRMNFKDSIVINLIYLFLMIILAFNIYMMYQQIGNPEDNFAFQMFFIYLALFILVFIAAIYTYPMLSRFEMSKIRLIKLSVLAMFHNFPISLLLVAIFVLSFLVIVMLPFGVLFMPGVCLYIYSYFMERVIRKYMTEEMIEAWDAMAEKETDI